MWFFEWLMDLFSMPAKQGNARLRALSEEDDEDDDDEDDEEDEPPGN
jgi:hypothetical protein